VDPLHLSLVFNLSHGTGSRYTRIAEQLLDTPTASIEAPRNLSTWMRHRFGSITERRPPSARVG
jgi:hypothetical protein